jgi:hypothetical protein
VARDPLGVGPGVDLVGAEGQAMTHLMNGMRRSWHDWRRRHEDFPEPVAKLKRGPIWDWPDVERWARSTRRL